MFLQPLACLSSTSRVASLSSLFAEQKDKAEPFDVQEVVEEMPVGQRSTLWGKLGSLLQDVLQELPPERWVEDGEDGMEVESAADPVSSL